jgi:putative transcriptional regulator
MIKLNLDLILLTKNIQQQEVSEGTGINKSTINRYCTNSFEKMDMDHLEKICRYLDITPNDVIEIKEESGETYEELSIEELINIIRTHNQINIYTVYEDWCVQLFELNICPNDIEASCNWENADKDLKKVLIRALEHIVED